MSLDDISNELVEDQSNAPGRSPTLLEERAEWQIQSVGFRRFTLNSADTDQVSDLSPDEMLV
jgi:hypothetical protein